MKLKFAVATEAPNTKFGYKIFGFLVGGFYSLVALIQLFRIDTLLPVLINEIGLDSWLARFIAVVLISGVVFAVPALFGMRLSRAFRYLSIFNVILVPTGWLVLSLFSRSSNIGFLGQFYDVGTGLGSSLFFVIWLFVSVLCLIFLGYFRR